MFKFSFIEELKAAGITPSERTMAAIKAVDSALGEDAKDEAIEALKAPLADAIIANGVDIPEAGLELRIVRDGEGFAITRIVAAGKAPRKARGTTTGSSNKAANAKWYFTGLEPMKDLWRAVNPGVADIKFDTKELLKTYGSAYVDGSLSGQTFQELYDELKPGK